ncbi:hypothetical protein ES703_10340 [subsurface metagenome]
MGAAIGVGIANKAVIIPDDPLVYRFLPGALLFATADSDYLSRTFTSPLPALWSHHPPQYPYDRKLLPDPA